ncbi:MAG: hypothetical protein ABIL70_03190 [candidate division WOR-3 bacterium]
MRILKYVTFIISIITMILAIIARLFSPNKVLFDLAALTYLRLTAVMLLYTITIHFLFSKE